MDGFFLMALLEFYSNAKMFGLDMKRIRFPTPLPRCKCLLVMTCPVLAQSQMKIMNIRVFHVSRDVVQSICFSRPKKGVFSIVL